MAFESISERWEVTVPNFPAKWLPLIYLYDPDLPRYPLLYFHAIDPTLGNQARPGYQDRVFGFVHHVNLEGTDLRVSVVLNKDLSSSSNAKFIPVVEREVKARLGLTDPITWQHLDGSLTGAMAPANSVLKELWYQVVDPSFGQSLPFGSLWDPVLGLVRFIASWNSDGGRKGELIQTHYFCSSLGVRIAAGGDINVDFYLLPTFEELTDKTNPLSLFGRFFDLASGAEAFCKKYCSVRDIDGLKFSAFELGKCGLGSKVRKELVLGLIDRETGRRKEALSENFNAFNRGPQRSIIALMMLNDLREQYWHPNALTPSVCAKLYSELKRSYQTPKVIQLYAQQCFGNASSLPVDIWVKTFLAWPLGFKASSKKNYYKELFERSQVWGKIERLIWLVVQARKVHSSVAAEILWCVRYGDMKGKLRGANPLACKICEPHIRNVCPAYSTIASKKISFNRKTSTAIFEIKSSAGDNTSHNQNFVSCRGLSTVDEYSINDRPERFKTYPQAEHDGKEITVSEFLERY